MGFKDFVGTALKFTSPLGYLAYEKVTETLDNAKKQIHFYADSVREFRLVKNGVEFDLSADDLSTDLEEEEGGISVTLRGGAQLAISEKFLNCPFDIKKISPRGRTAKEWSDAIEESSSISQKTKMLDRWASDIKFSMEMFAFLGEDEVYILIGVADSLKLWALYYNDLKSDVKNKEDSNRIKAVFDRWEHLLSSACAECIKLTTSRGGESNRKEILEELEELEALLRAGIVADALYALSIFVEDKPFRSYEIGRTQTFYWGKAGREPISEDGASIKINSMFNYDEKNNAVIGPFVTDYARREILVCTDEPCDLSALDASVPHVLCVLESDIRWYNKKLENYEDVKWKFEIGHPRNGVTYIQHPHEKNTYYTLKTFHSSMLERKHEELMDLLQALGATRVTASVTHSDGRTEKQRRQLDVGGGYKGDINNVGVGVSGKYSSSTSSAEEENLYHRLAQSMVFNETVDEPYIPDDLYFYQYERKWQQIAKAVLNKRLRECEVTLEYSNDYSINKQRVKKMEADLQYMIHSFNMNIGSEFEENLSQKTSMIWHYKVEFGSPKTKVVDAEVLPVVSTVKPTVSKSVPTVASVSVDITKGERLFLKRAKRYIQNDGKIDAEERADLEALAKKFGIDEFRFVELIEEAFDEG